MMIVGWGEGHPVLHQWQLGNYRDKAPGLSAPSVGLIWPVLPCSFCYAAVVALGSSYSSTLSVPGHLVRVWFWAVVLHPKAKQRVPRDAAVCACCSSWKHKMVSGRMSLQCCERLHRSVLSTLYMCTLNVAEDPGLKKNPKIPALPTNKIHQFNYSVGPGC